MSNSFILMWRGRQEDPSLFSDFIEFLNEVKPTLFGFELTPENVLKTRRLLLSHNLKVT